MTASFNLNEWLRDRQKQKVEAARRACPHAHFDKDDNGKLVVKGDFVSPPGTLAWRCDRCGISVHDRGTFEHNLRYYAENPKALQALLDKEAKLLKKAGF